MNNEKQKAEGHVIVRRLITEDTSAFWPEIITACTQLVQPGWGHYLETLVVHVAQMGVRLVALMSEDRSPEDIPISDWNAGAYITMYQMQHTLPCNPGVCPGGKGIEKVIVLDETSVIEDGRVGFKVTAYSPRAEDYLPGGIRLPMTDLDRITREIGSVKILIQNGPGQDVVTVSGIFNDENDTAAQEVIQKLRDTSVG